MHEQSITPHLSTLTFQILYAIKRSFCVTQFIPLSLRTAHYMKIGAYWGDEKLLEIERNYWRRSEKMGQFSSAEWKLHEMLPSMKGIPAFTLISIIPSHLVEWNFACSRNKIKISPSDMKNVLEKIAPTKRVYVYVWKTQFPYIWTLSKLSWGRKEEKGAHNTLI